MSGVIYFVGYVLFMIPTYVLAWGGSNSMIVQSTATATGAPQASHFQTLFFIHLGCLLALCALGWLRGAGAGKTWLVTFPALALVFDLVPVLSWIPFVPTLMHLLALIVGAMATQIPVSSVEGSLEPGASTSSRKPSSLAMPMLLLALAIGVIGVRSISGNGTRAPQAAAPTNVQDAALPAPAVAPPPERHEVKFATVTTNLMSGDRFAQIGVVAVFTSSEAAERATASAESIQADLIRELNNSTAESLLTPDGKARLAGALRSKIALALGTELSPTEVLFTSFIVQ